MTKRAFLPAAPGDDGTEPDDGTGSRTLIEQAYRQLRDDIIEGRLAPGEKLRVEHLRRHYAVGAGTLREAITRLVSDALVEAEGQRGFRVAPVALDDLEDLTRLRLHIEIEAYARRADGRVTEQRAFHNDRLAKQTGVRLGQCPRP